MRKPRIAEGKAEEPSYTGANDAVRGPGVYVDANEDNLATAGAVVSGKQASRRKDGSKGSIARFLAETSELREAIRRRRNGKPMASSVETLREIREEENEL